MARTSNSLTQLEHDALSLALAKAAHGANFLIETIPLLRVEAREFTGFGFYTKFEKGLEIQRQNLDETSLVRDPPSVAAYHPQVKGFIDFLVWIKDGQIDCLEAASTSAWPSEASSVSFDVKNAS